MKKTYIAPELDVQLIHTTSMIALSYGGEADDSEGLVKEERGEDIWGSSSKSTNVWDDNWSN